MSTHRRSFLKALAASAAALLSARPVVQAFQRTPEDQVADLLGTLAAETGMAVHRDHASCAAAAEDYGHLARGGPIAVAYPHTAEEVEKAIAFANMHGLRFTPRGVGHSQSGHSIAPPGGVTLDFSRMDRIEPPDVVSETIACGPGARWREVVSTASAYGLMPRVLPLYLDLTVGGVLSVGGVGPAAPRFGPAVANVAELEVITGQGRRLRCSPEQERGAFDAVLANLGRCAVITQARLKLRRMKPHVRTFYLLYDDIEAWLADQRALAQAGLCDALEGFCSASVQGLRNTSSGRRPFAHWFYGLLVSFEYESEADAPEADALLGGLHAYRLIHVEDDDAVRFAARYDPRFEMMRRSGAFEQAHPIFECILPADVTADVLPRMLNTLPLSLGDGHRLIFLAPQALPSFFMVPSSAEMAVFAVLPAGVAGPYLDDTLRAVRAVHQMCIEAGGKRYIPGWLGMMDDAAWRIHYGEHYDSWIAAKRSFDPNGVLHSMLFPEKG